MRKAAEQIGYSPTVVPAEFYVRIVWFHRRRTTQDIDNITKNILDALKGVVFEDDRFVAKCLAHRVSLASEFVVSGKEHAGGAWGLVEEYIGDGASDVLYIEVGSVDAQRVAFGPIDGVRHEFGDRIP